MANTEQQYATEKEQLKQNALPIGTILSSKSRTYRIVEILGAGGFGITYKVLSKTRVGNIDFDTEFAIKEYFMKGCDRNNNSTQISYPSTLKNDIEQGLQDFVTEANRLNKLSGLSPNIVKVNEVFEANGTAYYVMEYLNGGNLIGYVRKNGALSEGRALSIITPIAKAVQMLHDEKLLHLDIKPDNIVFKSDASSHSLIPILIDFGLAKHFSKSGSPTSQHIAKGATDGYAPQEQYASIDKFAPEIDVYALGATLYYMLTGKNPPKAFDISSISMIASALPAQTSSQTKEAILSAMRQSKFERTNSVKIFLSSINHTLADENNKTVRFHEEKKKTHAKAYIIISILIAALLVYGGVRWFIPPKTPLPTDEFIIADDTPKVEDNITNATNIPVATVQAEESVGNTPPQQDSDEKEENSPKEPVQENQPVKHEVQTAKQETVKQEKQPTPQKVETDAEKFQKALKANDWDAIKRLADKGYAEAYLPLAEHYLGASSTHALAEKYANKAAAAGKQGAERVKEVLKAAGYYD